ncbi:hypothetical protein [Streptomyces sp. NPDC050264]|uniref:hypothetical protein n=1 Tax=Streptomyces sp. NPDC050264 TaxID=3155038 RepID=UPI0034220C08
MKCATTAVLCAVIATISLAVCTHDAGSSEAGGSHEIRVRGGQAQAVPSPEGGQRDLLLHGLEALDSRLVADKPQAVKSVRSVCQEIEMGSADDVVRSTAADNFDASYEQADLIVQSIRTAFCGGQHEPAPCEPPWGSRRGC